MGLLDVLGLPRPRRAIEPAASPKLTPSAAAATATGQPVRRNDPPTATTGTPTGATPPPTVTPTATPTGATTGTPPPVNAGGGATAPTQEEINYEAERKAVKALADALRGHKQAARIGSVLNLITTKMANAAGQAVKKDWTKAMQDLAAARTLCGTGKTRADNWQTYSDKRALTADLGTSLRGLDAAAAAEVAGWVTTADNMMKASPQKFTEAMDYLKQIDDAMRPRFTNDANAIKTALAEVLALGAEVQTFLGKEIAKARKIVSNLDTALAASNWASVMANWRAGWDVLGGCKRYGERRIAYMTQRTTTAADIAAVKTNAAVQNHGNTLDAALKAADALASTDQMKMEDGAKALVALSMRCKALVAIAPTATSHDSERKLADAELLAIEKNAVVAAQLTEPLKAIKALLTSAAAEAGRAKVNGGDPTAQWQSALQNVRRARADLATATQLASTLGPAAAAKTAAAGAGGAAAMKKALDALQADADAAGKAAHADQAAEQLQRCNTKATEATKALEKGDAKAAADPLRLAADALAAARGIQAAHAQYLTTLAGVEGELQKLRALPTAKKIAPRIDAVANAVTNAKAHSGRHDAGAAIAALRTATDAMAAARKADTDRQAHDKLSGDVAKRLPEITDAKAKKPLEKAIEDAGKQADALDFAGATTALKKVLVQVDDAKLRVGMKATPPDPKLRDTVKAMVANGGADTVDKAIQDSPEGSPKVITELASARYGKEFSFEGSAPNAHQVKALKRCCEVFAKIADDIVDNPSIKNVAHADVVPGPDGSTSAGGGYTGSTGHIGMEGRVGIQQKFGKNETNYDPKTNSNVKSLPADIDAKYLPANDDDVEYLGFAAAHEVGHGVDDLRGFMLKNGSQPKYGGWTSYGGNVQPIADAVGPHIAKDHASSSFWKSAESKKYVLDKLLGRDATHPTSCQTGHPDFKQADLDAYKAFDDWHALATASDVYRRQGDCDAIHIGDLIYHEAYARSWVSYLAAERKKGLTGYQFRAPAEWFAELYAGWKSGQLSKSHPALEWLKKL
jgi:hypothetical protein